MRQRSAPHDENSEGERELWKCRGCGKRGKPKAGFPLFPRAPWKSRQQRARFPHFHSSGDEGGWKRAKPKAGFSRSPPPRILFLSKQKNRPRNGLDRKSTRLNSSHTVISYAVFCL